MSPSPTITRLEPMGPRGLRVLVHLDEGDPFEVMLEALERSRLGAGDTLDPARRKSLLDADADVRVREAALNLLANRARTRRELQQRLRRKGFGAELVDACLDRLAEKGLLDDAAVAAAFVRDRLHHRPRGRSRLTSELRSKGVEVEVAQVTIDQVFGDAGVSDERLARECAAGWLRRQGEETVTALAGTGHSPERDKAKRRLFGYLGRRGFGGEALRGALEHAERVARDARP